jgi:hypothetical protein
MSKTGGKRMSADAEDHFEENLEGGSDVGSLRSWKTNLLLLILKIEDKLAGEGAKRNPVAKQMLADELVTYNAALLFMSENPKAATVIGGESGIDSIIAYITKQAVTDYAKFETKTYSDMLIPHLPGYKLNQAVRTTGLVGATGVAALSKAASSTAP